MTAPVLIMAGGTGGHIFPGLAVAEELRHRGIDVQWLGGRSGLEGTLVPAAGINLHTVAFSGVRGRGLLTLLRAPFRLLAALREARRILRATRPRCVLSMGGYAAAPGGLAAWLGGVPMVVHEQNSVAGHTNRLLARLARRVLGGFADVLPRSEWVGNPVRAQIEALPAPDQRARDDTKLRILVLGGSQGARALNRTVPVSLAGLAATTPLVVRHQVGGGNTEDAGFARQTYARAGVNASVPEFIEDMADAWGWADLVIGRAGALTLAELACAGVPAILVPFPAAVDDHQTRNAQALVDAGAAVLVHERDLDAQQLGDRIAALAADRPRLLAMAVAARAMARPGAAARIADICLEVANERR